LDDKYLENQDNTMTRKKKDDLLAELLDAIRANQLATDRMDEAAGRALGINRTDGRCLDVIQRAGQISAGRLAQESSLTTGSVTAVLDRLTEKGYVRRVPDPRDRRRVLVELTELAEARSWAIYGPLGERGHPHLEKLSNAEIELLIRFMRLGIELNEDRATEVLAALARGEDPTTG
jgi:DNA-binding MarR family transcriptional regulator